MNIPASIRQSSFVLLLCVTGLTALAAVGGPAEAIAQSLSCPSCEDYDACTTDSCDETTGTCRHDPISCDDGNPCTNDVCRSYGFAPFQRGCFHTNATAGTACDDGKPCTGPDACDGSGQCLGSDQPVGATCSDGNVCTSGDVCDAFGACTGTSLAGTECDDRNACTRGERCVAAPNGSVECRAGTTLACDDGSICTDDSCDPVSGDCIHAPLDCDDGNPCTDDACDPATGACTRTARQGTCNDRNICTVGESCSNGNCVGGSPSTCGWSGQCGGFLCSPFEQQCSIHLGGSGCPSPTQCGFYQCVFNGVCQFQAMSDRPELYRSEIA